VLSETILGIWLTNISPNLEYLERVIVTSLAYFAIAHSRQKEVRHVSKCILSNRGIIATAFLSILLAIQNFSGRSVLGCLTAVRLAGMTVP
jgi:hypothetical protein